MKGSAPEGTKLDGGSEAFHGGPAASPVKSGASRSLAANASANGAAKLAGIALALVLSPFIVSQVGIATFGFWAIVSAFNQYAGLLDFGVGAALSRHVASHVALQEFNRVKALAAAGLSLALASSTVIIGCAVAACVLMPSTWTTEWPAGWQMATVGAASSLACMLTASAFLAFPRGLGRWDLDALPGLLYQLTFAVGSVALLIAGQGLAGLGVAAFGAGASMLLASIAVKRRLWSAPMAPYSARSQDLLYLVRYGANLQASAFVSIVNTQADKPAIFAFGGSLEFVGYYELASRVAFQLRSLPLSVLGPLTVQFAGVTAGKSVTSYRSHYRNALRSILVFGVGPLLATYGACFLLVQAWLGPGFVDTAVILEVLGVGYAVNLATGAGTSLANGAGRPDFERNYTLLSLGINLGLSVILGFVFGPWGVVAATSVGLIVSSFWLLSRMNSWLADGTGWRPNVWRESSSALGTGVLLGVAYVALGSQTTSLGRFEFLGLGLGALALTVAAWLLVSPEARSYLAQRAVKPSR